MLLSARFRLRLPRTYYGSCSLMALGSGWSLGGNFPAVISVAAGKSYDTRNPENFLRQTKSTKWRNPVQSIVPSSGSWNLQKKKSRELQIPHDNTNQSFRRTERLFKKHAISELHSSCRRTTNPLGRLQAQILIINQRNSALLRQFIMLYIRKEDRIVGNSQPISSLRNSLCVLS